jgi:hypothetical protein
VSQKTNIIKDKYYIREGGGLFGFAEPELRSSVAVNTAKAAALSKMKF